MAFQTSAEPEKLAGYAVGVVMDERIAEVASLAVLPEFQRNGLGEELLRRVCESLTQQYAPTSIKLHLDATNDLAKRLYERCGFVVTDAERDYYAPGRDACIMTLTLVS